MSVFEVNDLTKSFSNGKGIFNVTFEIKKGETLGFLGPNGSGKTTTIRCLMGFTAPTSGEAKICDFSCIEDYAKIKNYVGYLPAEIAIPNGLNGMEFIEMMEKMRHIKNPERLRYLLKRFDLNPNQNVKKMSIGEKRKLAIVVAFMSDPEILILDEPTSGLDPSMQEVFIDYLLEEKAKGKTILLSSHIFSEVEALCDRIMIIKEGKIISSLLSSEVKHGLKKTFEITFADREEFKRFRDNHEDLVKEADSTLFKVSIYAEKEQLKEIVHSLANYKLKAFNESTLSLEDYFMNFYKTEHCYGGVH